MHSLERSAYKILSVRHGLFLTTWRPSAQVRAWITQNSHALIRAVIREHGIDPFITLSDSGHIFNTRIEAEKAIANLRADTRLMKMWADDASKCAELFEAAPITAPADNDDLDNEYLVTEITIPDMELATLLYSAGAQSAGAWFVCVYYESTGFSYLKTPVFTTAEDLMWAGEMGLASAWNSSCEKEAIRLAKKVTRLNGMSVYAFARWVPQKM